MHIIKPEKMHQNVLLFVVVDGIHKSYPFHFSKRTFCIVTFSRKKHAHTHTGAHARVSDVQYFEK